MRLLFPLVLLCGFLLVGCVSTGDVVALVPIVGGEKIRVPLGRAGPTLTETDEVKIVTAYLGIQPDEHAVTYRFEFKLQKPIALRHVTVEDVASDKPLALVDDPAPKVEAQSWKGVSPTLRSNDPQLAWLSTVENTIRVFRFTIETADGRKIVVYQGTAIPSFAKVQIRHALGSNY